MNRINLKIFKIKSLQCFLDLVKRHKTLALVSLFKIKS